jgi:hypothetical protein
MRKLEIDTYQTTLAILSRVAFIMVEGLVDLLHQFDGVLLHVWSIDPSP